MEKIEYGVKELVNGEETVVKGVNGDFTISKAGEPYEFKPGRFSRKYSLVDQNQADTVPFLTLTLFDKSMFDKFELGDNIRVEYAMYERREGNNGIIYHNITIGKYGKINKSDSNPNAI